MDNDGESFGPTTSYMQCNLSRDVAADSDEEIFGPSSSYQVLSTLQLPNSAINISNLNFMFTEVDPPSNGFFSVPSPLRIGSGTSSDSDNEASGSDDELEFEDEYADVEDHVAADALADMTKVLSMEPETMTRIVLPPPSHATGDPGNPGAVAASSSQYSSSCNKGFAVQPSKQLVEDPVALWRRNNPQPNSLPPITSLYEVLNADLNNEQEELAKNVNYRVWNIVALSVQPTNAPRAKIDNRNRVCEDFIPLQD
ncbi:hypothetical protein M422DRAFT_262341 [Sphaerobolus stellatus SS14]|uniref:Uncharacterized protein n=1 Tax=Sphaerobolus stellatus (strain SS14) TaxID=990650 RepID=A0A0C9VCY7_SPHS4|nr:hypothetical protein M422DRAFT_262341 [Sphaerobolus stellatus SS14]